MRLLFQFVVLSSISALALAEKGVKLPVVDFGYGIYTPTNYNASVLFCRSSSGSDNLLIILLGGERPLQLHEYPVCSATRWPLSILCTATSYQQEHHC
jgi:hypothetical protein